MDNGGVPDPDIEPLGEFKSRFPRRVSLRNWDGDSDVELELEASKDFLGISFFTEELKLFFFGWSGLGEMNERGCVDEGMLESSDLIYTMLERLPAPRGKWYGEADLPAVALAVFGIEGRL